MYKKGHIQNMYQMKNLLGSILSIFLLEYVAFLLKYVVFFLGNVLQVYSDATFRPSRPATNCIASPVESLPPLDSTNNVFHMETMYFDRKFDNIP